MTKYELKAIFAKAKEIKMVAYHTTTYTDFRASNIKHFIPLTETYSCQIVISVQPDYIEGLCLNYPCTTEAHEI